MQFNKVDVIFNLWSYFPAPPFTFVDEIVQVQGSRNQLLCLLLRLYYHIVNIFTFAEVLQVEQSFEKLLISKYINTFETFLSFLLHIDLIDFVLEKKINFLLRQYFFIRGYLLILYK